MHLPFEVADYVDFYCSQQHATNVGRIFRPDGDALTPNWQHLPIGYHGRAGTVVVSGTDVRRPSGQRRRTSGGRPPSGPADGWTSRPSSASSSARRPSWASRWRPRRFADHVFGVTPLNDWSARDIQAWEYVPLGPVPRQVVRDLDQPVDHAAGGARRGPGRPAGPGPGAAGLPRGRRAGRLRHRLRGGAQRRGGEPAAVRRDVLVARPDARAPDRQRRLAAHRRPVRQRHDQRRPSATSAGRSSS